MLRARNNRPMRSHNNRPMRSAKQVQLAPGYVDSSTLLFDSDDEGSDDAKSDGKHDSDDDSDDGANEGDNEDRHIAKKPRFKGALEAEPKKKVSPSRPDSSCLAYYPETYAAVQKWNRMLGLPPPHPMRNARTTKLPKREVAAPVPHVMRIRLRQGAINTNASYDETKAGFEKLPGEIRSEYFPSDLLPCCVTP